MIKLTQGLPLVDPVRKDLSSSNNAAVSVLLAEPKTSSTTAAVGDAGALSYAWKLCSWEGGKFKDTKNKPQQ